MEGSKYQVQIYSDHKNLVYFTTTKELNRRQMRWMEVMSAYNFKISYVKGTENARADALSRKPEYVGNKTNMSHAILKDQDQGLVFNHKELAVVSRQNAISPWSQDVIGHGGGIKIAEEDKWNGNSRKDWKEQDVLVLDRRTGLYMYNNRIWVNNRGRETFVKEQHELPAHGHQGVHKTMERIKRTHYFPGMRKMVTRVVTECDVCIRNKAARHAPYGKLKSPDTPDQPWKSIAWDFVVKLPISKEPVTHVAYDSILVITDRLTKYAYFVPYKEATNAEDLAYTFLKIVVANHGTPEEIISDRDKLFTSKFWSTLMALLGTKLKMSTSFHPQTDGQTERLNQTLEAYLRCYINYQQDNWVQLLPLAQFAYNSAEADSTKTSPFYANYGFHPEAYHTPRTALTASEQANVQVGQLKSLHQELVEDIKFMNQRAASYYNAKRSMEPTLKKGDRVYLLRKNIKTARPSDKLDHRKLGPYEIAEVKGPVNYKLRLPKAMNIHPVFHISLLEPAPPGAPRAPNTEIQPINPTIEYEVEQILDCKLVRGSPKYLVQWKGYPQSENSWEPRGNLSGCAALLADFHLRNPGLPRKDQKDQSRREPRLGPGL